MSCCVCKPSWHEPSCKPHILIHILKTMAQRMLKRPASSTAPAPAGDQQAVVLVPGNEDKQRAATAKERQDRGLPRAKFCTHELCQRVYVDGPGHRHHNVGHVLRDVTIEELSGIASTRKTAAPGEWTVPRGKHKRLDNSRTASNGPELYPVDGGEGSAHQLARGDRSIARGGLVA
jgi:hypothetical protein